MTDQTAPTTPSDGAPEMPASFAGAEDAARFFSARLAQSEKQGDTPQHLSAERAEADELPATAEHESADEADTLPEEVQGETQEDDPEAEKFPPIDPPRSWTKDDKELFKSLPRETQERLAERERSRESDFLRRQNEAAEKLKAVTAKEQAAEQVRQQLDSQLAAHRQALHEINNREFGDIKSMADVEKIANAISYYSENGDPVKAQQLSAYLARWQVHQQKMAVVEAEFRQAEQRKDDAKRAEWDTHVKGENAKFFETLSDSDKGKLKDFHAAAPEFLQAKGFSEKELNDLASGNSRLSVYDHRVQSLILDGMKFRDMQKAAKTAVVKPVPAVQRPGARPSGNPVAERTKALDSRLTSSGNLNDAVALLQARRAGSRR